MSVNRSNLAQRNGCLSLGRVLILILGSVAIFMVLIHQPLDITKLVEYILLVASFLLVLSPRSKLAQYPFIALLPFSVMVGIVVYSLVIYRPINVVGIFLILASYAFFLIIFIPQLRRKFRSLTLLLLIPLGLVIGLLVSLFITHQQVTVFSLLIDLGLPLIVFSFLVLIGLLYRRSRGRKNSEGDDWILRVGETPATEDFISQAEKPFIHLHIFGISFKVLRIGKYITFTISSE